MLRIVAAAGWKSSMNRSWKLDASMTSISGGSRATVREGVADVPRCRCVPTGSPEHLSSGRGHGGLPVGTGYGGIGKIHDGDGILHLADKWYAQCEDVGDRPHVLGEPGAGNYEIDLVEKPGAPITTPDGDLVAGDMTAVVDHHVVSPRRGEACCGDPAYGGSEHKDPHGSTPRWSERRSRRRRRQHRPRRRALRGSRNG